MIRTGDAPETANLIVGEGELDIVKRDYAGPPSWSTTSVRSLCRDPIPRTGTVTAVVDSQLDALHSEDFLAAVTGHRAAYAEGEAAVEERLAPSSPV